MTQPQGQLQQPLQKQLMGQLQEQVQVLMLQLPVERKLLMLLELAAQVLLLTGLAVFAQQQRVMLRPADKDQRYYLHANELRPADNDQRYYLHANDAYRSSKCSVGSLMANICVDNVREAVVLIAQCTYAA